MGFCTSRHGHKHRKITMKLKFLLTTLLAFVALCVFGQDSIQWIHNGDTLWIPVNTTTVGNGVSYTKPGFEQQGVVLYTLLQALATTLLVYLSYLFPKLRDLNVAKLADPRVRAWVITAITSVAGFFGKFQDDGNWLTYALPGIMAAIGSTGVWEQFLKKIFGGSNKS